MVPEPIAAPCDLLWTRWVCVRGCGSGCTLNGVGSEITSFPRVPNSCVQPLLVGVAVLCLVAILTRRVYVISRRTTTRMLVLPQAYGKGQKAKGVISLNAFFCAKAEDAGKNEFTVYVRYWCMGDAMGRGRGRG